MSWFCRCEPCTTQEPATPIDPNPCPTRPDCEPCMDVTYICKCDIFLPLGICSTMEMANPTLPSTVTCPKCPEITPPLCPTCPAVSYTYYYALFLQSKWHFPARKM